MNRPLIMGIINCTPDSFFAGSRTVGLDNYLRFADRMISDGTDILDIGGESTRPGSSPVTVEEEISRVIPLIDEIRKSNSIPISIDTSKAKVAEAALNAGADIINDISALSDPNMPALAAERGVFVVLMHMLGVPKNMQDNPVYSDTVSEIMSYLEERADLAVEQGVKPENIIIDPGIGFGKRLEDNLMILHNIEKFKDLGYPLLIGLSRKSFIGKVLKCDTEDRLAATIAANLYCAHKGADIIRVHDAAQARDSLNIISAIEGF